MRKSSSAFLVACFLAAFTAFFGTAASAEVVTFSNLTTGNCASQSNTVTSGSFTFSGNNGFFVCNPGVIQNNTSPALIDANGTSVISMAVTGGGSFDLNSFFAGTRTQDFNPLLPSPFQGSLGLSVEGFYTLGGSIATTYAFTGVNWQEFFLPSTFAGLSSATFTALGGSESPQFLIDDISVNGAFVNAAVPEPGTWAMMLIGFGAMGVSLRRRRRTATNCLDVRFA